MVCQNKIAGVILIGELIDLISVKLVMVLTLQGVDDSDTFMVPGNNIDNLVS